MYRVLTFAFAILLCGLAACSQQSSPPQPAPSQPEAAAAPSASPVASPSAMAVAPPLTTPSASSSAAPSLVPSPPNSKDNGKQAKTDQKPLPPDLWERMTRPLTLEEINKLPPETRDMILRAQGRLPASPAPKKK
ncbi:MAG TPA: hypothetical protein VFZ34_01975 [Blastocatellia bacterium]|nr:hypothetical protein [Blastocatellia bacterium]